MSENLPISLRETKQADFAAAGLDVTVEKPNISSTERTAIHEHTEIILFFGAHGTEAENYLAVEELFDTLDPSNTTLLFENAGYSRFEEKEIQEQKLKTSERMRLQREAVLGARNSHNSNYLTSLNAFSYARAFAQANGYRVGFADWDKWDDLHFTDMLESSTIDIEHQPIISDDVTALVVNGWRELNLLEAAVTYHAINNSGTMLIDSGGPEAITLPLWGEMHRRREEAAVAKLLGVATREAERNQIEGHDKKHRIVLFFGEAHKRGILKRMRRQGVAYSAIETYGGPLLDSANDVELDGATTKAFFAHWLGTQLRANFMGEGDHQARHLNQQIDATIRKIPDFSVASLQQMYEAARVMYGYFDKDTSEMTPLAKAKFEFTSARLNKGSALEYLINQLFEENGASLNETIEEHHENRALASNKFYGR